jgi:hypothetical protein
MSLKPIRLVFLLTACKYFEATVVTVHIRQKMSTSAGCDLGNSFLVQQSTYQTYRLFFIFSVYNVIIQIINCTLLNQHNPVYLRWKLTVGNVFIVAVFLMNWIRGFIADRCLKGIMHGRKRDY